MGFPTVTYSFTNATTADATQVNQNFTDLINALSDGSKNINISALTAGGVSTLNGNVTLGASSSNLIVINASVNSNIPVNTNTSYDFGSATLGLRSIYIGGSSTFSVRILGPTLAGSYTLTLPVSGGTSRYCMETDGSGVLSFQPHRLSPTDARSYSLSTSIGSNNLTIVLKYQDGTSPSASQPIDINVRSSTATTGQYVTRSVTSSVTLVLNSGSTMGHSNGVEAYIYIYAIDNAGTIELAASSTYYDEGSLVTTTAEGGGSATSYFTMYSSSARSNVGFRLVGRLKSSQATAGTFASAMEEVSLLPIFTGRQIVVGAAQTSAGTTTSSSFAALGTNNPSITFTPGKTGRYKISMVGIWDNSNSGANYEMQAQIAATVGSPVTVFNQIAAQDNPGIGASSLGIPPTTFSIYNISWLTLGTSYTFQFQGKTSAGTLELRSDKGTGISIIAEQMD